MNDPQEPTESRGAGALFWLLSIPLAIVASIGGAVPIAFLITKLITNHDNWSDSDAAGAGMAAFGVFEAMVAPFFVLLVVFAMVLGSVSTTKGTRGQAIRWRLLIGLAILDAAVIVWLLPIF